MNTDDCLKDYIEKRLEELIKRLNPKIKKKCLFRIVDECITSSISPSVYKTTHASCYSNLKPPLITIYLGSLKLTYSNFIVNDLTKLLTHEIIHSFGIKDEKKVENKIKKMNFFKT